MAEIGKRIRMLRKNKDITQEKLAEILSVSPQSVSKWENGISVPDVELLPIIARYFGITMDELFNYRLDALNYKERFIRFMVDNGVLQFGSFELKSGRISPYIVHTSNYQTGAQITKLGQYFAECIRENNVETDTLIADAKEEIPVIISTSMVLYKKYGIDMNYSALHSIGKKPEKDDANTLIMDIITSGKSVKKALQTISELSGTEVKSVVVTVDRMERGESTDMTAKEEIERDYNVKIYSIVTLDDIIQALENGVIAGTEYLEAMKQYRKEYGMLW